MQAASLAIFPSPELGLRMPVALAALALAWLLAYLVLHTGGPWYLALAAALFFLLAEGVTRMGHMARAGDQDIPFALCLLLATLAWRGYLRQPGTRTALVFGAWLAAALLIKSFLVLVLAPGWLAMLLLQRRFALLWQPRTLLLGVWGGLVLVLPMLLLELQQPGALATVMARDGLGRLSTHIDAAYHGPWHYVAELWALVSAPLLVLAGAGALVFAGRPSNLMAGPLRSLLVAGLCFLVVLSAAQTQYVWYAAFLFPVAALLATYALSVVLEALHRWLVGCPLLRQAGMALLLLSLLGPPYYQQTVQSA